MKFNRERQLSTTVDQLIQAVDASTPLGKEISAYAATVSRKHAPVTAEELVDELFREGMLTEYQARKLVNSDFQDLQFANYIVLERLGEGGMGKVFRVRHHLMGNYATIKIIPISTRSSRDTFQRFFQEVRVASRLEHLNIVKTFDAGDHNGVPYLVMEFIDGKSLQEIVSDGGPLRVEQAIDYVSQTAEGLRYAHERGVVHRDIKPSNLMMDLAGRVKVLDFGLARIEETAGELKAPHSTRLTRVGQILGTYNYMAPEQALGAANVDSRADIYSLGCTLYFLLTGSPPYCGRSPLEVMLAHVESDIPAVTTANPDVDPAVNALFQKMVAKSPPDRLQSTDEVLIALFLQQWF